MRLVSSTAAVVATVFALSGAAFAAQTAPAAKPAKATTAAKAPKATVITATGTVSKFDAATNTLTVTTPKGDVAFMVDSAASVTANGKKVMASDLPSHVGHKVTVRYTEANGQKMASSVKVTMAAAKTASAKKTSTKKTS
jgi:DNA-binding protein HU-beta